MNRAYYAVFYAIRAVLALDEIDMKHHSGVIAEFRKRYIKTGIFPKALSSVISLLSDKRTESDYNDYADISAEISALCVASADQFVEAVHHYLKAL